MSKLGRGKYKLYFKNHTLDFNLQYILGYESSGGAAVGEIVQTISNIKEKDFETWVNAFTATAIRVENYAKELLAKGHKVSARESFLRAATYHRAASFCTFENDKRNTERVLSLKKCFFEASQLFEPALEQVFIPYEGKSLPGYFIKPNNDNLPKPTLIMIGGGELFHEELYFWTGDAGKKRNWNVLIIDLPGQGSTILDGMIFTHETEKPFKVIIDYLETRADVNTNQITSLGVSYGGYLVFRAVSFEKRLAAIALSAPMPDAYEWLASGIPFFKISRISDKNIDRLFNVITFFDKGMRMAFEKWFVRMGVKSFSEVLKVLEKWKVDMSKVDCPVYCLVGEGESDTFKLGAKRAKEALGDKATYRMATIEEGADGHCQSNNYPMLQQLVFDWFEEKLNLTNVKEYKEK